MQGSRVRSASRIANYNLSIPRYVDTFEEEVEIDLDEVKREISTIETELVAV